MLARLDEPTREGEFRGIRGKGIGRHLIAARLAWPNRDIHILPGIQRHVVEFLLAALAWMRAIEIERERIEKLQLPVILEQVLLLDPLGRLRILRDLGFELLLPI